MTESASGFVKLTLDVLLAGIDVALADIGNERVADIRRMSIGAAMPLASGANDERVHSSTITLTISE